MREVLDIRIDDSNEDCYFLSTNEYGPDLFPTEFYSVTEAIDNFIENHYDKEVEYFVKIDDATIYSTKSSKTFTEQQVLMTTGQILDEVHKLRFFVNSDKTVCSVASVVAPYKDYPIDMKSEDILKDYLTVMMNYIIPDNVKMPGVEFHDS